MRINPPEIEGISGGSDELSVIDDGRETLLFCRCEIAVTAKEFRINAMD